MILGGIPRGYSDKYSDIDIIVFCEKVSKRIREKVKKILNEYKDKWGSVDICATSIAEEEGKLWDMEAKWAYSSAKIIYYDPEGKIKKLIKRKTFYPKKERFKEIAEGVIEFDWYISMADLWIYRGDIASAHYSLNSAVEAFFRAIYAINDKFLPPLKWRLFLINSLQVLLSDIKRRLKDAMKIKKFNQSELKRRKEILREIFNELLPYAEKKLKVRFGEFYKFMKEA